MVRIGGWWDATELWIAGLPFVPQFLLLAVVLVPLAFGVAWVLDRALIATLTLLGRGTAGEPVRRDGGR